MPVFEWANEGRVGDLIAFAKVEAGLSRTASSGLESREGLKAEREKREEAENRAESAEKKLSETRRQLQIFKRKRFQLENPEPEQSRVGTFKSLLAPLKGERLLDLGCGHGKFSLAAAELGWAVTAVDARTERMPVAEAASVEWIQSDVREFVFGKDDFDCISVLGLLYHLGQPDQMSLLSRCAGTLTILDTHVGINEQANENGYKGSYYNEPGETEEERKTKLLASWGNSQSFWPTEESLIRMVRDVGFSLVAPVRPPHRINRTFYICYP